MRPPFPNPDKTSPQVKICGLTRLEDALVCAEAGADAIGINFWPGSKRHQSVLQAMAWLPKAPASLTRVAVLVNATPQEIQALLDCGEIDALQFHGDEPPEFVAGYMARGISCLRALSVTSGASLAALAVQPAKTLLLDAFQPGVYGGTGQTCDWPLAKMAVRQFPERQIILCGGLTPENVAEAVRTVHPAAVDVASGVESAPGLKDAEKVRKFVAEVHRGGS